MDDQRVSFPPDTNRSTERISTFRVVAGPRAFRFSAISEGDEVVIGRSSTGDLNLEDTAVSREHAVVIGTEDGVEDRDLGSLSGTSVNERRLGPGQRAQVMHGDQIQLGATTLRMEQMDRREVAYLGRFQLYLLEAERDPLTGLLTCPFLDEEMVELMEMHRATGIPLSLVFLDIDGFADMNDEFGRPICDPVLGAVARMMRQNTRVGDPVVRFGRDEFVGVLSGCTENDAVAVAERMRECIAGHHWLSFRVTAVTVSIGIAELTDDLDWLEWIRNADQALHRAKAAGRNRCVSFSELS
jgi:diguanylate cyclase (GGDEF)-like protein